MLTKAQQEAQVQAATLTGAKRYTVEARQGGGHSVRDHEEAEWVANADGVEILSQQEAHDLGQEYIYS